MIIDAHVHLPVGNEYIDMESKKKRLLLEMKNAGVDKCIAIADSWPESDIGSNSDLVDLFEGCGNVYVIGGISPFKCFSETLENLDRFISDKKIKGIKLFTGHEEFYLTDECIKPVYELAMKHNVPVLFHSGWDNVKYGDVNVAEEVIKEYPHLQFVCCHCWYPEISKCMGLIKYPNIAFDLSSVADNEDILDKISAEVKALTEKIPDRVMFGSDSFGCSMEGHIKFVTDLGLVPDIEQKVLADNAIRIYGL